MSLSDNEHKSRSKCALCDVQLATVYRKRDVAQAVNELKEELLEGNLDLEAVDKIFGENLI